MPLIVSANRSVRSKGVQLPWRGLIHITCDGQRQVCVTLTSHDRVVKHNNCDNDAVTHSTIMLVI